MSELIWHSAAFSWHLQKKNGVLVLFLLVGNSVLVGIINITHFLLLIQTSKIRFMGLYG